jgi:hypothetical protein
MTEPNKPKILPTELREVKEPTSIQECLQFLAELSDPQTNADKYKRHLTGEYFQKNVLSLTLEQLNEGLSYPYIKKKYSERQTLKLCIENDIAFPMLFNCIIQKGVPLEDVYKYADILSRHGKVEDLNQIYDYYQFHDNPVVKLFKNTSKPSDTLIEVMIRNDASYILKTKSWDDEKVINWLKENKTKTTEIISKIDDSTLRELPINIQLILYEALIPYIEDLKKQYKNDSNKYNDVLNYERNCLVNYPISYIHYLQKNNSSYLDKKFKQTIRLNQNKDQYLMNLCQYVLINRKHGSLKEIENTFNPYLNLIQQKIKEGIGLFVQEISPFEYGLKYNTPALFFPFDIKAQIEERDKDMFLAAAFSYLPIHIKAKERNHTHAWYYDMYPQVITNCTNQEFEKYYKRLEPYGSSVLKELDNFMIIREINNCPTNNNKQEKKLKV